MSLSFALRGHAAETTALCFVLRPDEGAEADTTAAVLPARRPLLLSGDADGWLFVWDLALRRPLRRWRPHPPAGRTAAAGGVIHIASFTDPATGGVCIASQGRDNAVRIWRLDDILPTRDAAADGDDPKPSAALLSNSLNFCRIAVSAAAGTVLLALPNLADSELIDVFDWTTRTYVRREIGARRPAGVKTGLAMCMALFAASDLDRHAPKTHPRVRLAVGYESGDTMIWALDGDLLVAMHAHSEPVMALDAAPDPALGWAVSVAADANVVLFATHAGDGSDGVADRPPAPAFAHTAALPSAGAGQVRVRADGKAVAVGGWNGAVSLFKPRKLKLAAAHQALKESVKALEMVPPGAVPLGPGARATAAGSAATPPGPAVAVGAKDGRILFL